MLSWQCWAQQLYFPVSAPTESLSWTDCAGFILGCQLGWAGDGQELRRLVSSIRSADSLLLQLLFLHPPSLPLIPNQAVRICMGLWPTHHDLQDLNFLARDWTQHARCPNHWTAREFSPPTVWPALLSHWPQVQLLIGPSTTPLPTTITDLAHTLQTESYKPFCPSWLLARVPLFRPANALWIPPSAKRGRVPGNLILRDSIERGQIWTQFLYPSLCPVFSWTQRGNAVGPVLPLFLSPLWWSPWQKEVSSLTSKHRQVILLGLSTATFLPTGSICCLQQIGCWWNYHVHTETRV